MVNKFDDATELRIGDKVVFRKANREWIRPKGDVQQFVDDLERKDFLAVLIRGFVHIEIELFNLLETKIKYEPLEDLNLRFGQMVDLAVGLDLMPIEFRPAYRALGKLRNKFAHRVDWKLSEADWQECYESLAPEHRELLDIVAEEENVPLEEKIKQFLFALHVHLSDM